MVILIAMQSIMANIESHNSHDKSHHSREHHVLEVTDNTSTLSHVGVDSPTDCHKNHCHHGSLVYIDLPASQRFEKSADQQTSNRSRSFSSWLMSPVLRPPIV